MNREVAETTTADIFTTILAPWIATSNDGDLVIRNDLITRLAQSRVFLSETLPTQIPLTRAQCKRLKPVQHVLVGGTNLLSTYGRGDNQWPLPRYAMRPLGGKLILMGVGWRRPELEPKGFPRSRVVGLLNPSCVHSVRDRSAATALEAAGMQYLVTGCPSLLRIPDKLGAFSTTEAVVTITDYFPDARRDRSIVRWARERFPCVRLQPQGSGDVAYAKAELGFTDKDILSKGVVHFQRYLEAFRPVYVGTRLHGGIVALQMGLPTVIVGIDNRAVDMGQEFDLPVAVKTEDLDAVLVAAQERMPSRLHLAHTRTEQFVRQLRASLLHT